MDLCICPVCPGGSLRAYILLLGNGFLCELNSCSLYLLLKTKTDIYYTRNIQSNESICRTLMLKFHIILSFYKIFLSFERVSPT